MKRALTAAILLTILIAALGTSAPQTATPAKGRGDLAFYQAVLERVRAGEPYYSAAQVELRARHYPMQSVFNWRTPLLAKVLALVPQRTAGWILLAVCILLGILAGTAGNPEAPLSGILLIGTVLMPPLLHESWAGLLIGFSAVAYLRGWTLTGAVIAAAALFVRELVAPYVVVCAVFAMHDRRIKELGVWGVTLLAYAAYFWRHAAQVAAHVTTSDLSQPASWVQFGGIGFLVSALHTAGWLPLLPRAAAAVALVLLCSVLFSRSTPALLRAWLAVYGLFFSVVGQPFNWYWGLLVGPLCALALGYSPAALKMLFGPPEEKSGPRMTVKAGTEL